MNEKLVRKKILNWLAEIRLFGVADRQRYHITTRSFQIKFNAYNDTTIASTKMFQQNATKYFESQNINISNLNITNDNINDFIKKLLQLSKPNNLSDTTHIAADGYGGGSGTGDFGDDTETCQNYCSGPIRDMLLGYKSVHGYISLVVSTVICLALFFVLDTFKAFFRRCATNIYRRAS